MEIEQKAEGFSQWRGEEILEESQAKKLARFWPHLHHTGGFFIARFQKIKRIAEDCGEEFQRIVPENFGELKEKLQTITVKNWNYSEELQGKVWKYLEGMFGIEKADFEDVLFVQTKFSIQAVSKRSAEFFGQIFIESVGSAVLKVLADGSRIPLVGVAKMFGSFARKNVFEIDDEQAKMLMNKLDIVIATQSETKGKQFRYTVDCHASLCSARNDRNKIPPTPPLRKGEVCDNETKMSWVWVDFGELREREK